MKRRDSPVAPREPRSRRSRRQQRRTPQDSPRRDTSQTHRPHSRHSSHHADPKSSSHGDDRRRKTAASSPSSRVPAATALAHAMASPAGSGGLAHAGRDGHAGGEEGEGDVSESPVKGEKRLGGGGCENCCPHPCDTPATHQGDGRAGSTAKASPSTRSPVSPPNNSGMPSSSSYHSSTVRRQKPLRRSEAPASMKPPFAKRRAHSERHLSRTPSTTASSDASRDSTQRHTKRSGYAKRQRHRGTEGHRPRRKHPYTASSSAASSLHHARSGAELKLALTSAAVTTAASASMHSSMTSHLTTSAATAFAVTTNSTSLAEIGHRAARWHQRQRNPTTQTTRRRGRRGNRYNRPSSSSSASSSDASSFSSAAESRSTVTSTSASSLSSFSSSSSNSYGSSTSYFTESEDASSLFDSASGTKDSFTSSEDSGDVSTHHPRRTKRGTMVMSSSATSSNATRGGHHFATHRSHQVGENRKGKTTLAISMRTQNILVRLTEQLPYELFLHVCSYLDDTDYRTLLEVSLVTHTAITGADASVWRQRCLSEWRFKQGFQNFANCVRELELSAARDEMEIMALQQRMLRAEEEQHVLDLSDVSATCDDVTVAARRRQHLFWQHPHSGTSGDGNQGDEEDDEAGMDEDEDNTEDDTSEGNAKKASDSTTTSQSEEKTDSDSVSPSSSDHHERHRTSHTHRHRPCGVSRDSSEGSEDRQLSEHGDENSLGGDEVEMGQRATRASATRHRYHHRRDSGDGDDDDDDDDAEDDGDDDDDDDDTWKKDSQGDRGRRSYDSEERTAEEDTNPLQSGAVHKPKKRVRIAAHHELFEDNAMFSASSSSTTDSDDSTDDRDRAHRSHSSTSSLSSSRQGRRNGSRRHRGHSSHSGGGGGRGSQKNNRSRSKRASSRKGRGRSKKRTRKHTRRGRGRSSSRRKPGKTTTSTSASPHRRRHRTNSSGSAGHHRRGHHGKHATPHSGPRKVSKSARRRRRHHRSKQLRQQQQQQERQEHDAHQQQQLLQEERFLQLNSWDCEGHAQGGMMFTKRGRDGLVLNASGAGGSSGSGAGFGTEGGRRTLDPTPTYAAIKNASPVMGAERLGPSPIHAAVSQAPRESGHGGRAEPSRHGRVLPPASVSDGAASQRPSAEAEVVGRSASTTTSLQGHAPVYHPASELPPAPIPSRRSADTTPSAVRSTTAGATPMPPNAASTAGAASSHATSTTAPGKPKYWWELTPHERQRELRKQMQQQQQQEQQEGVETSGGVDAHTARAQRAQRQQEDEQALWDQFEAADAYMNEAFLQNRRAMNMRNGRRGRETSDEEDDDDNGQNDFDSSDSDSSSSSEEASTAKYSTRATSTRHSNGTKHARRLRLQDDDGRRVSSFSDSVRESLSTPSSSSLATRSDYNSNTSSVLSTQPHPSSSSDGGSSTVNRRSGRVSRRTRGRRSSKGNKTSKKSSHGTKSKRSGGGGGGRGLASVTADWEELTASPAPNPYEELIESEEAMIISRSKSLLIYAMKRSVHLPPLPRRRTATTAAAPSSTAPQSPDGNPTGRPSPLFPPGATTTATPHASTAVFTVPASSTTEGPSASPVVVTGHEREMREAVSSTSLAAPPGLLLSSSPTASPSAEPPPQWSAVASSPASPTVPMYTAGMLAASPPNPLVAASSQTPLTLAAAAAVVAAGSPVVPVVPTYVSASLAGAGGSSSPLQPRSHAATSGSPFVVENSARGAALESGGSSHRDEAGEEGNAEERHVAATMRPLLPSQRNSFSNLGTLDTDVERELEDDDEEEEAAAERMAPVSWKFSYYMAHREARRSMVTISDLVQGVWLVCFRGTGMTHPVMFTAEQKLIVLPPLFGPQGLLLDGSVHGSPPANRQQGHQQQQQAQTGGRRVDASGGSTGGTGNVGRPAGVNGSQASEGPQPCMPPLAFHILRGGTQLNVHNFPPLKVTRRSQQAAAAASSGVTPAALPTSPQAQHSTPQSAPPNDAAFLAEPHTTLKRLRYEAFFMWKAEQRKDALRRLRLKGVSEGDLRLEYQRMVMPWLLHEGGPCEQERSTQDPLHDMEHREACHALWPSVSEVLQALMQKQARARQRVAASRAQEQGARDGSDQSLDATALDMSLPRADRSVTTAPGETETRETEGDLFDLDERDIPTVPTQREAAAMARFGAQWQAGGIGDVSDDWGWTITNYFVRIFSIDVPSPLYVERLRRIANAYFTGGV